MQFDTQEQKIYVMKAVMEIRMKDNEGEALKAKDAAAFFDKYVKPFDLGVVIALKDQIIPKKYKPKPPPVPKTPKAKDGD